MAPGSAGEARRLSFEYCSPVPRALECPICRGTLDDPVQTPCEHLYCRACLAQALALSPACPLDRAPLHSLDQCSPAPRPVLHLLDDLDIRCTAPDCALVLRREQWDAHARTCTAARAADERDPDSAAEEEGDDGEPPILERCELCSAELPRADLETHPTVCPAAHVPCAYCSRHLPRASHPAHLLRTCPLVPLPCPHAHHGCSFSGPRAQLHEEHLPSECVYEPLAEYLELQDGRMRELEADNWALRARVARVEDALAQVQHVTGALKDTLGAYYHAPPSPIPAPRARPPASPPPAPAPAPAPLAAALAALTATQSTHHASLSALAHAHSQHAQHAHSLADEVAALRAQLGAVRVQVGNWAMLRDREREREWLSSAAAAGAGAGAGRVGMGARRRSDGDAAELDATASGSDDEPAGFAVGLGPYAPGAGGFFRRSGLPLPPGLRYVVPDYGGGGGGGAGMGMGWDGGPAAAAPMGYPDPGLALGLGGHPHLALAGRGRGVPIPLGGAGAVKL